MNNVAKIGLVTGKIVLALFIAVVIAIVLNGVALSFMLLTGTIAETELIDPFAVSPTMTTVLTIIQSLAFIVATLVMVALFDRRNDWGLGWRGSHRLLETVKGMLIGIVLISLVFVTVWLLGGLEIVAFQWNTDIISSLALSVLLFASVAVSEELFSRGYVQGLVKHQFGPVVAIIVSSLLFALLHSLNPGVFSSPLPVINLLLAGLLLGISRELSGSLWLPIGFHFTWNLWQGNVYGFPVSGMPMASVTVLEVAENQVVSGGSFGAEGSIVATIVLLSGVYLIYRLHLKR